MIKITFVYDRKEDIYCLLNYGKPGLNSGSLTAQYEELLQYANGRPLDTVVNQFIDEYLVKNNIDIDFNINKFQKAWENIETEYHKRAENIFGVSLEKDIIVYLTINSRCPYNIKNNKFYCSIGNYSKVRITMHELWHFYTWYAFGEEQEEKRIGIHKYNEIKEALTVLLNLELKDLMEEGIEDKGYPDHKEIRNKIAKMWEQEKNIKNIWTKLTA